jgi:hypothetical protein|nr:MAG TPA_asm: hypothetical protein [Caudoviricetes sp.]
MKKVKIEFNIPEKGDGYPTFSLSVENMDIDIADTLGDLPAMVREQYKSYRALFYGRPDTNRQQGRTDTQ